MNRRYRQARKQIFLFLLLGVLLSSSMMESILVNAEPAAGSSTQSSHADKARIIITKCSSPEGGATPGQACEVTITLKNTSKKYTATSILVTHTSDLENIYPDYNTPNQVYIDQLKPQQEKTITMQLHISDATITTNVLLDFNITYADSESSANEIKVSVPLLVSQSSQLEVDGISVSGPVTVGAKTRFRITIKNSGAEDLFKITMNISGSGLKEVQPYSLGTISAGKSKGVEVYLEFQKIGTSELTVKLQYEDSKGETYTKEVQPASFEIAASQTTEEKPAEEETNTEVITQHEDKKELVVKAGLMAAIVFMSIVVLVLALKYRK